MEAEKMKRTDLSAPEAQNAIGTITPASAPKPMPMNMTSAPEQNAVGATAPAAAPEPMPMNRGSAPEQNATGMQRLTRIDTSPMEADLRRLNEEAKKQQTAAIDQATRTNAEQLRIAEREAQAQYDEQRRQTNIEERQAMDNSALYAAARGDRGGIGQAQYNAIQANAARNRAAIGQAQAKLSSDVTRQIAELRRQGEFKKADALLTLSQQYLSQLNDLKRWTTETNISIDQANNALAQWEKSYAIDLAGVTGEYNGEQTLDAKKIGANIAYQQGSLDLDRAIHEHNVNQDAIKNAYNDRALDADIAHNQASLDLDRAIHEHNKEQDYLDRSQAQREIDANNGWTLMQSGQMPNAKQLEAMDWSAGQAQKYINDAKALKAATDAASAAGDTSKIATLGWKSLDAGIMPSATQLDAMDMDQADAQARIDRILGKETPSTTTTTTSPSTTTSTPQQKTDDYDGLFTAAAKAQSPENYIASHYKEYGFNSATGLADAFTTYQKKTAAQQDNPANISIGVIDPATNRMITRADPRVLNVTYDSQGRAVYHLKDGRVLTDTLGGKDTSKIPGKTITTYLK